MWMVLTAGGIALAILIVIIALIVRAAKRRPPPAPPTPQEIALRKLREAEADVTRKEPYDFSIQVSDILRQYVSARYHLHAREQTSPEFLRGRRHRSPHFTGADKTLLGNFLEQCDLIEFARIEATVDESKALLQQAVRFVKGETAMNDVYAPAHRR